MNSGISLSDAHNFIAESYRNGSRDDAERMASSIVSQLPGDFFANKIIGMIGRDVENYSVALTFLRNALRKKPDDAEVIEAVKNCLSGMQEVYPEKDIYVIGDSHTEPFRRIERTVVRWVGPVTMHRISQERAHFLDYRFYGVKSGFSVVCVFGEIDGRAHVLKGKNSLEDDIDSLVSGYLQAIKESYEIVRPARQIVSSLVPPGRNVPRDFPTIGSIEERVKAARMMNDRIRFGCMLLGFEYLDQYSLFCDEDGALDERFSPDGLHIDRKYAEFIAKPLSEIFSR